MNKSDKLMEIIDRIDIFQHCAEFEDMGFSTRSIDVGNTTDRSSVPIHASVTSGTTYQRNGDPSRDALCCNLASLENSSYCLVTASGMSAVTLSLFGVLKVNDKIICHKNLYLWSDFFVKEDLKRLLNIDLVMLDLTDVKSLEYELKKSKTALILSECISNPMLEVIDVKKVSELAHKYGSLHIVDNTFASPYLFRPIEHGADIVVESATKYINGHGDTLCGAILTNSHDIYVTLQRMMGALGPCLSPFHSFLVQRGIQTLSLRMEKHCDNAEKIAEYLENHPMVTKVIYPGLKSHPQHELASKQFKRYGGMISFTTKMTHEELNDIFCHELKLFKHWVSLGEAHSLISPKDEDKDKGIPKDLVRLSIGLEDVEDLINDLDNAFNKIINK